MSRLYIASDPRLAFKPKTLEQEIIEASRDREPGFIEEVGAAFGTTGLSRNLAARFPRLFIESDPSFVMDDEMRRRYGRGLPEEWWDALDGADSEAEAEWIRTDLQNRLKSERILENAGFSGIAWRMFAGLTDPAELTATIAVSAALTPTGGAAVKAGTVATRATASSVIRRAATVGTIDGLTDTALAAADDALTPGSYGAEYYIGQFAASFVLGGTIDAALVARQEAKARKLLNKVDEGNTDRLVGEYTIEDLDNEIGPVIEARRQDVMGRRRRREAERLERIEARERAEVIGGRIRDAQERAERAVVGEVADEREAALDDVLRQYGVTRQQHRDTPLVYPVDAEAVANNMLEWRRQFDVPVPSGQTEGGAFVYKSSERANQARESIQRQVDLNHSSTRNQQQNIPRETRTRKPSVVVEPRGRTYHVRVIDADGFPMDIIPYAARTAEARTRIDRATRLAHELEMQRQWEIIRPVVEAGDAKLTDKGRVHFRSAIEEASTPPEVKANRAVEDYGPPVSRELMDGDGAASGTIGREMVDSIDTDDVDEMIGANVDRLPDDDFVDDIDLDDPDIAEIRRDIDEEGEDFVESITAETEPIPDAAPGDVAATTAVAEVGAAFVPAPRQAEIGRLPDKQNITDWNTSWAHKEDAAPDKSAFRRVRYGMASTTGNSDSPEARKLSALLFSNSLPDRAGRPVVESAEEYIQREYARSQGDLNRQVDKHFRKWKRKNGVKSGVFDDRAREEFYNAVTSTIRGGKGSSSVPEIEAAADAYRNFYKERLDYVKRNELAGFENVDADPQYAPVMYNQHNTQVMVNEHGREVVNELFRRATFANQLTTDPTLRSGIRRAKNDYAKAEKDLKDNLRDIRRIVKRRGADKPDTPKLTELKKKHKRIVERMNRHKQKHDDLVEEMNNSDLVPLPIETQRRLANAMVDKILRKDYGMDEAMLVFMNADSSPRLRWALRQFIDDIGDDEMNQIVDAMLKPRKFDSQRNTYARHRITVDPEYMDDTLVPGKMLSIADVMETRADLVSERYNHSIIGGVAMQKVRHAMEIDAGRRLRTDDDMLRFVRERMVEQRLPPDHVNSTIYKFGLGVKRIRGQPLHDDMLANNISAAARDVNMAIQGAGFVIAQIADSAIILGRSGLMNTMRAVPEVRRMIRGIRTGEFTSEQGREIQAMLAIGSESVLDHASARMDQFGSDAMGRVSGARFVTSRAAQATGRYSGLLWLDGNLRRVAAVATIEQWKTIARTGRLPDKRRLALIGLSEDDARRIIEQIKKHRGKERIGQAGVRNNGIGIEKWDDQELASKFMVAVNKFARSTVMQGDMGQASAWMTGPTARMILQFRMFGIQAWEKVALQEAYARDWRTMMVFTWGMMLNSLVYSIRAGMESISMEGSQREEFLDDRLSLPAIAAGGFRQSAFAGYLPGAIDQLATGTGLGPAFGGRFSLTDTIFSNPTVSNIENLRQSVLGGGRALLDPDHDYTQSDFRSLRRVMPWNTMIGVRQVLDKFQYSLPEQSE